MPLTSGARLGPYEIVSLLGAGGMGEVYLARDTRLAREVAVKVLSPHLAETPEARARFEREARAASSLNHPNICALYDVGRQDDVDYLVLEKVDGETLAARLLRGPLATDQVLRFGIQIADALDRAHRSGLVHRDLKPGNIMLAKSGAKLMDFGLAILSSHSADDPSLAHTLSPSEAQPVTAKGTMVGTSQYMAPELLEGKAADARSDLWALGCVLYEMATGKRAFEGKSQASLISAILSSEPPRVSQLAPLAPPALDRLVLACLAKDPDERIQSAHDVMLQLRWIAEGGAPSSTAKRPGWRTLAGAAAALVVISVLATLGFHRPQAERASVRFLMGFPPGQISMGAPCISPDGRTIAFVASDSSGESRIWLRPMGSLESRAVPGTENASPPFWSPDHKSLAFVMNGKLKKVPVAGGAVVNVADVGDAREGGSWGSTGWILMDGSRGDSLIAIPVAGGEAKPASRLDRSRGDQNHASPRFLPDGRHFIFMAYRNLRGQVTPAIMLGTLGTLEAKELGPCTGDVEFVPPHYVLYTTGTSLVAQTLDIGRGKLTGDPIPLADGIPPDTPYLFSAGGSALAVTNATGATSELVWLDRSGRLLSRVGEPNRYRDLALSPDERSVAVAIADPVTGLDDVWVRDLERNVSTRLTFDRTQETGPVWSADGTRVFYSSDREGDSYIIYSADASGTGSEDTLRFGNAGNEGPMSVSSDGKWLVIIGSKGATWDWDILVRDVAGKEAPRPLCASPSLEFDGVLSPDGRWVSYVSDETGRGEIYVRSFPDGKRKWRVSSGGGTMATWSKNELIYQNPTKDLIAVPVGAGADFQPGKPVTLFHADISEFGWSVHRWAVTSDGQRFLVNQSVKNPLRGITVTTNWQAAIAPER